MLEYNITVVVPQLQLLLQEVAWDEGSRERKREARLHAMAQHEGIGDLGHEPLFCTETALKVPPDNLAQSCLILALPCKGCRVVASTNAAQGAACKVHPHKRAEEKPTACTYLQAFHWTFLSYRFEEHAGADVETAASPEDPDALEVSLDAS